MRKDDQQRTFRKLISSSLPKPPASGVISTRRANRDDQVLPALQAGLEAHRAGNLVEARKQYEVVVKARPRQDRALQLLGIVLHQLGETARGEALLRQAISINDSVPEYHANLGGLLFDQELFEEALICFQAALKLQSGSFETFFNLARTYRALGQLDQAAQIFKQAVAEQPHSVDALNDLGVLHSQRQEFTEAERCFEQILQLKPRHAVAWNNLGLVMRATQRDEESANCFQNALQINPRYAEAQSNIGLLLRAKCRYAESLECFRKAIQLKPDFPGAHSSCVYLLNYEPNVTKEELFQEHLRWGEIQGGVTPLPPPTNSRVSNRRLRIGYVSPDFRSHAVRTFFEPVLRQHNHDEFEIHAYAEVLQPDAVTERFRNYANGWRFTHGMSDKRLATMIRADEIDILVDLAGHTSNNRLRAFAWKPAPVQVSYLGYPNTTGLRTIDYYLGDPVFTPPEEDRFFCEQVFRLPRVCCFDLPTDSPPVSPSPAVQRGYVTFGSLHRLEKLTPAVINLWAAVMTAIPTSRLLIFRSEMTNEVRDRLMQDFAARSIAAERLDLRSESIENGYLSIYNEIDIGLDVFPWNGGTTTLEALWMGVTVLGLAGDRCMARGTASTLTHIGHPELIAADGESYVAMAKTLAADTTQLAQLRDSLREKLSAAMGDSARFTRDLEAAYRTMWQRWCETPTK